VDAIPVPPIPPTPTTTQSLTPKKSKKELKAAEKAAALAASKEKAETAKLEHKRRMQAKQDADKAKEEARLGAIKAKEEARLAAIKAKEDAKIAAVKAKEDAKRAEVLAKDEAKKRERDEKERKKLAKGSRLKSPSVIGLVGRKVSTPVPAQPVPSIELAASTSSGGLGPGQGLAAPIVAPVEAAIKPPSELSDFGVLAGTEHSSALAPNSQSTPLSPPSASATTRNIPSSAPPPPTPQTQSRPPPSTPVKGKQEKLGFFGSIRKRFSVMGGEDKRGFVGNGGGARAVGSGNGNASGLGQSMRAVASVREEDAGPEGGFERGTPLSDLYRSPVIAAAQEQPSIDFTSTPPAAPESNSSFPLTASTTPGPPVAASGMTGTSLSKSVSHDVAPTANEDHSSHARAVSLSRPKAVDGPRPMPPARRPGSIMGGSPRHDSPSASSARFGQQSSPSQAQQQSSHSTSDLTHVTSRSSHTTHTVHSAQTVAPSMLTAAQTELETPSVDDTSFYGQPGLHTATSQGTSAVSSASNATDGTALVTPCDSEGSLGGYEEGREGKEAGVERGDSADTLGRGMPRVSV
jgi:hypothetical protein